MKADEIPIPDPCAQPWDAMRRVAGGRYCEACRKTVVDLSALSPRKARKLLRQAVQEQDPGRQLCATYLRSADGEVIFERSHGGAPPGPRNAAAIVLLVAACNGEPREGSTASAVTPTAARAETPITTLVESEPGCTFPAGPLDEPPPHASAVARGPRDIRVAGWVGPHRTSTDARSGALSIKTRPLSEVHVDGKLVGTTPVMNLVLLPGKHRVLLVNEELELRKELSVEIRAGERVTHVVDLTEGGAG